MAVEDIYLSDVEMIMSHRYDQGWDFWTTEDRRLLKGAPFSAFESALFLMEIGVEPGTDILRGVAQLFFEAWREDGQFRLYPKGSSFPCQTVHAVDLLCQMGYVLDERVQETFRYLRKTQHHDGGWRCNKFFFGRGPETEYSNPLPTLLALSAFRFSEYFVDKAEFLDRAVDFLLWHWEIRTPVGPCHYGMGTLFMQVEYPFRNYNLFLYVYILSFYERARKDWRFLEAFEALKAKRVEGQIVVERVVPKFAKLEFCKKGAPSALATKRYLEILRNLALDDNEVL